MIAFYLWPIPIYRYGIMYVISFLCCYGFFHILKQYHFFKEFPRLYQLIQHHIDDLFVYLILGVLIGGRAGEIIIYNLPFYLIHPEKILAVRNGWMSFIGGFIGVMISFFLVKKRFQLNNKELFTLFDIVVALLPLGIILGRLWNFLNQELYGRPVSELPIVIQGIFHIFSLTHIYPKIDTLLRVNTNFLSIIFEGIFLLIITQSIFWYNLLKKHWKPGMITGTFMIGYGIIRFILEYLRQDSASQFIGIFSLSQYFLLIMISVGIRLLTKKF